MWSEVTGKISLQEDLTNEGGYVCCCIVLCLCYYLYLLQNTENCITLSISTHIFENHSIIFAVACQMTKNYSPLWTFPELDQVHCNEITMSHVQTQGLRKGEQGFIFSFARQCFINFNSKTNAHPVTSDFCLWTNGLRQNWCCNEFNEGHKFGKSSVAFLSLFLSYFSLLVLVSLIFLGFCFALLFAV